ncbi:MAG: LacI family transcriptional regulator [Spirochaetaceae bacterium]|nr:LacI family transcriptional regulator [Spirochaetaceae bacterium]
MTKSKISIHEVAEAAGVSKSTVSRVISDKGGSVSRRSVLAVNNAIEQLGYKKNVMAASLRTQKTYMILVMIPDVANPFWSEIARAAQDRLEMEGYSVVIGSTDWHDARETRYFELARSSRFDGLILNSVTDDIGLIKGLGVPAVLIGERVAGQDIDTVGTDTMAATKLALQYLYEAGSRHIAIATSDYGGERYLSLRRRAYREFLETKGLAFDPGLSFSVRLSKEGGKDLVRQFLAIPDWRQRVDSLFCGNDILAIAAINEFRRLGVMPGKDISIVGMDDIPDASNTYPPLTTVRKPRQLIGTAAAEILLSRIKDPEKPLEKRLFPGQLVVRESVVHKGNK